MNSIKTKLAEDLREAGWHSRGYLPHFDGGELAQTINWRLADSLPQTVLKRWKNELAENLSANAEAVLRRRIESYLDQGYGNCALKDKRVAGMIQKSLLHFDDQRYRLSAWVLMPNHVHILVTPDASWSLPKIMKSLKSYTAHEANKILGRSGQLWMEDYFDRYVRDERHFRNAISYIEYNPLKAGLCKKARDWKFSSAWFRNSKSDE